MIDVDDVLAKLQTADAEIGQIAECLVAANEAIFGMAEAIAELRIQLDAAFTQARQLKS
jgi:hypothetical protein